MAILADSKQSLRPYGSPLSFKKGASFCKLNFFSAFVFLRFHKAEEVQHLTFIPSDSHSGFYFPPSASKDRAVNSMEIKDFIILWTYSQWRQAIVVIPPLSPEREICDILLLSFIQTKWNQLSTDFVGPPFFQERSIVSHAFLFLAFLFLRFRKVEEV